MNKGPLRVIAIVLADILIAALLVGGWWVSWKAGVYIAARKYEQQQALKEQQAAEEAARAAEEAAEQGVQEDTPAEEIENDEETELTETETPEEEVPDNRTEWQIKFADKFTDEVVVTDTSYTSPDVSITITSGTYGEGSNVTVYYVADIYISNINCFQSYFARNQTYPSRTDLMPRMVKECESVLAINGDYAGMNFGGIVLRNGTSYINSPNGSDSLILFSDGTMETILSNDYDGSQYEEGEVYQIWTFGPSMLDENGVPLSSDELNMPSYIAGTNPRTGIGYYEPGHYCFVVADGRQTGYSKGLLMPEFAEIFQSLGCRIAYNLDGGGSSMMMLGENFVNRSSTNGERDVPDIIIIKDVPAVQDEAEEQP